MITVAAALAPMFAVPDAESVSTQVRLPCAMLFGIGTTGTSAAAAPVGITTGEVTVAKSVPFAALPPIVNGTASGIIVAPLRVTVNAPETGPNSNAPGTVAATLTTGERTVKTAVASSSAATMSAPPFIASVQA